jgi:FAD/FMN-containing dehydrogenase
MRGVWVNSANRIARAQAGCLLGDVDRETQLHGLAAVLGFISNTGIAGLTLGGGFGYLTRKYGWTSDNVRSMEIVTAEGRIVQASATENPDLFWGLCGGGGNFGVVTGFEFDLYPVGPQVLGGVIAWPGDRTDDVLAMYRDFTAQAPPELTCAAILRLAPPAPWLPADIHGKPIAAVVACHAGPLEEARRDLAPLKNFGSPVGDVIQPRPYTSQQSLLDATQPKGRRYYWKSDYLSDLNDQIVSEARLHAESLPSPHSAIIFFHIGGALERLPEDHSAVGNRNAEYVLNITAAWDSPADDERNIDWARAAWQDMRRFSTGGTYINFQTEDEGDDRIQAAYGRNYQRLVEIKFRWDPNNLFRTNKNISPRIVG